LFGSILLIDLFSSSLLKEFSASLLFWSFEGVFNLSSIKEEIIGLILPNLLKFSYLLFLFFTGLFFELSSFILIEYITFN